MPGLGAGHPRLPFRQGRSRSAGTKPGHDEERIPRRGTARRRDRAADRRRAPCRGRQRLADPGDRGAAGARARATGGPTCRCCKAASTISSPTARANCSTAPGKAASTCSSSPADRSTAQGNVNLVSTGDYAHPQGALPRLVRLGLSLLRGAEGDPVPHRAFAPHAGAEGRFHQRAGRERAECLSPGRADRADHQPLPVLASPMAASRSPACIPATRSRK